MCCSVENVVELIVSLIPPQDTRLHTQTRYHTAVSYNSADDVAWLLSLLLLLAASQRGTFLPSASSVYHTMAAARGIDDIVPTKATLVVGLAALGQIQRHEPAWTNARRARSAQVARREGTKH